MPPIDIYWRMKVFLWRGICRHQYCLHWAANADGGKLEQVSWHWVINNGAADQELQLARLTIIVLMNSLNRIMRFLS